MYPFKFGDSVLARFNANDEWEVVTYICNKLGTDFHVVWSHNSSDFFLYNLEQLDKIN